MGRYPVKQVYSRQGGKVGAAGDGLEGAYNAIVQNPPVGGGTFAEVLAKGYAYVTLPALHLSQLRQVHASTVAVGEAVLVMFDENRLGHVVSGPGNETILEAMLATGAVTTSKIAGEAVTEAKLAGALREKIVIPLVETLPASPVTGQEIYFATTAMREARVRWRLVYDGTNFIFVGGASIVSTTKTLGTGIKPKGVTVEEVSGGPTLEVPAEGQYGVKLNALRLEPVTANKVFYIYVGVSSGSVAAVAETYAPGNTIVPLASFPASLSLKKGETVKAWIFGESGTEMSLEYAFLEMVPKYLA